MEIVDPPVGIAHITGQIPDLIADRMTAASRVRVACAMQPKAAPHFGTGDGTPRIGPGAVRAD